MVQDCSALRPEESEVHVGVVKYTYYVEKGLLWVPAYAV